MRTASAASGVGAQSWLAGRLPISRVALASSIAATIRSDGRGGPDGDRRHATSQPQAIATAITELTSVRRWNWRSRIDELPASFPASTSVPELGSLVLLVLVAIGIAGDRTILRWGSSSRQPVTKMRSRYAQSLSASAGSLLYPT